MVNNGIVHVKVLKKKTSKDLTEIKVNLKNVELVYKQHNHSPCFGAFEVALQNYLPKGYITLNKDILYIPIGYQYLCIDKSGVVMVCVCKPININGLLFPTPGTKYKLLGGLYLKTDTTVTDIFKESEVIITKIPTFS